MINSLLSGLTTFTTTTKKCEKCSAPVIKVKNKNFEYSMCLNMNCETKSSWKKPATKLNVFLIFEKPCQDLLKYSLNRNCTIIIPHKTYIEKAKKGNEKAMHQLYVLYASAMLNTAFRVVNIREDAEDVLQESFIKAFTRLHQFRYQSTFGAWLKRIVINTSIDALKKRNSNIFLTNEANEQEYKFDSIDYELEPLKDQQIDQLYIQSQKHQNHIYP